MADEEKALQCKQSGNKALQEKDYDMAIACFTEGLGFSPNNSILYSNRSAAYASQAKWKEALVDACSAVQFNPKWGKAHARKALALLQMQRFEEAIEACKGGLSVEPGNQALQTHLKDAENALEASERNVIAEEMLSKGKYEPALQLLDTVVELHPSVALYWSNRSQASLGARKYVQAKGDAEKVVWLKPEWHKGYQRMGEVLYAERNYEAACSWYAKALGFKPGDSGIMRLFSQAQQENALEKARQTAASAKKDETKDESKEKEKEKEKKKKKEAK